MYRPSLSFSLDHPWVCCAFGALADRFRWLRFADDGTSFLPEFNEGSLTVGAVTIPGTSLAESDQLGTALEKILLTVPEVRSTARRTGRAELDEHVQSVESAEIDVDLKMANRPKEEVLQEIRDKVSVLPGTNVSVGQPISHRIDHMLSGTLANIAVKIFGDDLPELRVLAKQVNEVMADVPGVVDLSVEQQTDIPTLRISVGSGAAAARYGLPAGEVTQRIETVLVGVKWGGVLEGQVSFPLVAKYEGAPAGDRRYAGGIREMLLDTPPGSTRAPLARRRRFRKTAVRTSSCAKVCSAGSWSSANGRTGSADGTCRRSSSALALAVKLPQGYRIEYGGQFESAERAYQRLLACWGSAWSWPESF